MGKWIDKPPVRAGNEYIIRSTGDEGDTVGFVEDFAAIIPDSAVGDVVTVEIDVVKDQSAFATLQ